jgi:Holliday junction resolvase RusA-like endonuclease
MMAVPGKGAEHAWHGDDRSPVEDIESLRERSAENPDFMTFFVTGEPQPQGSTKSFYIKRINSVVTTHGNKDTKAWQERIAIAAGQANTSRAIVFYSGDSKFGYKVECEFIFTKPKSAPKKRTLNTKRPDLDKLVRAVLDGLTNSIIPDDAQVVEIAAKKRYGAVDECPGARITITRLR